MANFLFLSFEEILAIFSIAESVATSHISAVILHVDFEIKIIEQQLLLPLKFFYYFFAGH